MKFLFNKNTLNNNEKKPNCYCANGCVAKQKVQQNIRKSRFLTAKDFGGYMPYFCPFLEKFIFLTPSDYKFFPNNKFLLYDKNTKIYSWNKDTADPYRQSVKDELSPKPSDILQNTIIFSKRFR